MPLQNPAQSQRFFVCRVHNSASVIIPLDAAGFYPVPFDGTRFDNSGGIMHSNTVNNSRLIAPIAGYYSAWVGLQIANTGQVAVAFVSNSGSRISIQSVTNGGFVSLNSNPWFLNKDEYIEIQVRASNSQATLTRTSPHALEASLALIA
jgi:hypothetical protein